MHTTGRIAHFHSFSRSLASRAWRTSRAWFRRHISLIWSRCRSSPASESIDFDQQNCRGVERKAEMRGRLDRHQDPLVHHFQRGRNDAGGDDGADRFGGVVDRVENRPASSARPCGSRVNRVQILVTTASVPSLPTSVPTRSSPAMSSAGPPNWTIEPSVITASIAKRVIDRHAVFQGVRTAGIGGHVAADRAGPLARRIGSATAV